MAPSALLVQDRGDYDDSHLRDCDKVTRIGRNVGLVGPDQYILTHLDAKYGISRKARPAGPIVTQYGIIPVRPAGSDPDVPMSVQPHSSGAMGGGGRGGFGGGPGGRASSPKNAGMGGGGRGGAGASGGRGSPMGGAGRGGAAGGRGGFGGGAGRGGRDVSPMSGGGVRASGAGGMGGKPRGGAGVNLNKGPSPPIGRGPIPSSIQNDGGRNRSSTSPAFGQPAKPTGVAAGAGAGGGAEICAVCNHGMYGSYMILGDYYYHSDCSICHECHKNVWRQAFYQLPGVFHLICEHCYDTTQLPQCSSCNKPVKENGVSALNKTWHQECLFCFTCHIPIAPGTQFGTHNNAIYCASCIDFA